VDLLIYTVGKFKRAKNASVNRPYYKELGRAGVTQIVADYN